MNTYLVLKDGQVVFYADSPARAMEIAKLVAAAARNRRAEESEVLVVVPVAAAPVPVTAYEGFATNAQLEEWLVASPGLGRRTVYSVTRGVQ